MLHAWQLYFVEGHKKVVPRHLLSSLPSLPVCPYNSGMFSFFITLKNKRAIAAKRAF